MWLVLFAVAVVKADCQFLNSRYWPRYRGRNLVCHDEQLKRQDDRLTLDFHESMVCPRYLRSPI